MPKWLQEILMKWGSRDDVENWLDCALLPNSGVKRIIINYQNQNHVDFNCLREDAI